MLEGIWWAYVFLWFYSYNWKIWWFCIIFSIQNGTQNGGCFRRCHGSCCAFLPSCRAPGVWWMGLPKRKESTEWKCWAMISFTLSFGEGFEVDQVVASFRFLESPPQKLLPDIGASSRKVTFLFWTGAWNPGNPLAPRVPTSAGLEDPAFLFFFLRPGVVPAGEDPPFKNCSHVRRRLHGTVLGSWSPSSVLSAVRPPYGNQPYGNRAPPGLEQQVISATVESSRWTIANCWPIHNHIWTFGTCIVLVLRNSGFQEFHSQIKGAPLLVTSGVITSLSRLKTQFTHLQGHL